MALNLIRGSIATAKMAPMTRLSHHAARKFQHALSSNTADVTQLDNGLTVATEKTNNAASTVGIYLDAGARHESAESNGITNFIEKLLFRSTKSRDAKKLQKDLHTIGAHTGSFTNRENTGLFLTVSPDNVNKAIEILSEMISSPSLSTDDIEATRKEVLRELESQESNFQQIVMDYLHSVAYQETSLAFSKYGPTANIERFTKHDIEVAMDSIFKPARIVVAASGNVDHKSILNIASKSFSGLINEYMLSGIPSFPTSRYTGSDIRVRDDSMNCCHVAFAVESPGYDSIDSLAFDVMASWAGKWDLTMGGGINTSSYMGMISAAEHLTQSFQAFNISYKETGLFGGYFVGERMQLEETLWQLQYQFKRLCTEMTNNEIALGKNILMTKLIKERENTIDNNRSLATEVLRYGNRSTLEDWKSKIDRINSSKILQLGDKHIWDRCPVISALGPCENLPNYEEVRMKMSWMRY